MEKELIDKLDELQTSKNEGRGISCVQDIVHYLCKGNIKEAKAIWSWDGDKIRQYSDVDLFLIENLGCRTHGRINCEDERCKEVKNQFTNSN